MYSKNIGRIPTALGKPRLAVKANKLLKRLRDAKAGAEFEALARDWKEQSRYLSSPIQIAMLPTYQRIIGMGRPVVPLIIEDLRREPDFWFWALRAITGEDPVRAEDRGDLEAMTKAWLNWARERGIG